MNGGFVDFVVVEVDDGVGVGGVAAVDGDEVFGGFEIDLEIALVF